MGHLLDSSHSPHLQPPATKTLLCKLSTWVHGQVGGVLSADVWDIIFLYHCEYLVTIHLLGDLLGELGQHQPFILVVR